MTDEKRPEHGRLGLSYTLDTSVIDGGLIDQTLMMHHHNTGGTMWISCKDRMPRPCVTVLAWFDNGGYPIWAYHNEGEWRATLGMYHLDFPEREITHWWPLAAPAE